MSSVDAVGLLIDPDRCFAAELLSSIADTPAVGADRCTAVAVAQHATDPELLLLLLLLVSLVLLLLPIRNYDKSMHAADQFFLAVSSKAKNNRSSTPLKNRVGHTSSIVTSLSIVKLLWD